MSSFCDVTNFSKESTEGINNFCPLSVGKENSRQKITITNLAINLDKHALNNVVATETHPFLH